jgi:8-oxo-dGTP pyrophosphatase MutT (NUDIX family)
LNVDGPVTAVTPVKTGVHMIHNSLRRMDSGFCRNDEKGTARDSLQDQCRDDSRLRNHPSWDHHSAVEEAEREVKRRCTLNETEKKPPEPRPASTVVLLREHEGSFQVYLLKRSPRSAFFPGNYVFPGGGVSTLDRETMLWRRHLDLPVEEAVRRLGGDPGEDGIIAYGVSAIRETFEEAGVLLCRRREGAGDTFEESCRLRTSEGLPEGWLRKGVEGDGWTLAFSVLARWSHWITPEAMPKRFDTRFFLAFMPSGQSCAPDQRETTHGVWLTPEEALKSNLRGETPLSPPTLVTLSELFPCKNLPELNAALKTRTSGRPLLPIFRPFSRGGIIIEPWDPMYGSEFEPDASRLDAALVSVGEPFSRIWYHEGIWRPVRA